MVGSVKVEGAPLSQIKPKESGKVCRLVIAALALVTIVFLAYGAARLNFENPMLYRRVVLSTSLALMGSLIFWGVFSLHNKEEGR